MRYAHPDGSILYMICFLVWTWRSYLSSPSHESDSYWWGVCYFCLDAKPRYLQDPWQWGLLTRDHGEGKGYTGILWILSEQGGIYTSRFVPKQIHIKTLKYINIYIVYIEYSIFRDLFQLHFFLKKCHGCRTWRYFNNRRPQQKYISLIKYQSGERTQ